MKAKKLSKADVATLLQEFGQRSALSGGNPYRAKAYKTASQNLAAIPDSIADLIADGKLTTIAGIGEAIAQTIEVLYKTGTHPKLEEMRKSTPDAVIEFSNIPGLRAEQALKIYHEAGVKSVKELEKKLKSGALSDVKGFTPAFQKKLLQGIEIKSQNIGRMHIHRAAEILTRARENLEAKKIGDVLMAGEYRRKCELVSDLSLVVVSDQARKISLDESGIKTVTATHKNEGARLLFATGSAAHLKGLKRIAKEKGLSLTSNGLKRGGKTIAAGAEEDIYAALGLPFIEPELREGRGEIERALSGKLPRLVTEKDLKGILHAHTTESDGGNSLADMAEGVRARGFQYFGLSDHSQSAHYAGGLLPDEISAQQKEVDKLNRKFGKDFHVFKGIESDIRVDGSLDYPDKILKTFDFVVASVHSQFRLSKEEQTKRIITAVKNPYTTILGHMTGRQLLRRPGYELDIEAVLKACAKHNVVVEINGHPWRLDLDWRWHQRALELGCMFSLDPDAHSIAEIDLTDWSVAMARKGGIPKERVLNCLDRAGFQKFISSKRKEAAK